MRVSKVEIVPICPKQGLIGFASIELNQEIVLHSIAIHRRRDGSGYRLTYPMRSGSSVKKPLFHPTCPSLSKKIEECIFNKAKEFFDC